MAKMIPERPSEDTSSSAERKFFSIFRNMPETEHWVIFHSLAIAKHETQSQGEADFVVIIPGKGVFTLEVKGGRISHADGKWYSTDRNQVLHSIKNPVEEANNAAHSIKDYVAAHASAVSVQRTLFGFGVVFPDTTIHDTVSSVEIADEQIADYDDCLTSADMHQYLLRLAKFWEKRRAAIVTLPTSQQCAEIISMLRPNFNGGVSLRSIIHNVENQVIELTDNQQDIFETIKDNDRCIIKGSAGTGKTILALHYAREQASECQKIGFFCYNKQLSGYLNSHIKPEAHLTCGSFTEYMESVVEKAGKPLRCPSNATERNQYYTEILPQLFTDAFIDLEETPFDCLILDEAQDLLIPSYLEAMDLILKDGIQNGRWYFFMDAEKQNLFHKENKSTDIKEMLKHYQTYFTRCELRDNCRNSVAIIEKIDSIFGTVTRHRNNDERGAEVTIKTYRKTSDEVDALAAILRTLDREGIAPKDITILSPVRFQNSAASMVTGFSISPGNECSPNTIFYSTIHGFKGLENSVIILTDIANLSDEARKNILYVGMTRAKSALYILINDKASQYLYK